MSDSSDPVALIAQLQATLNELGITDQAVHAMLQDLKAAQVDLRRQFQQVQLEQQHYQDFFKSAPDGYLITDLAGIIWDANWTVATWLGGPPAQLVGQSLLTFMPTLDVSGLTGHQQPQPPPAANQVNLDCVPLQGQPFAITAIVTHFYNPQGELTHYGWLIRRQPTAAQVTHAHLEQQVQERTAQLEQVNRQLHQEIAEHKRTEAALRKSEEQFRKMFDQAAIAISLANIHTNRIVRVNAAHRELLGYTDAELATMTHIDLTVPEDANKNLEQNRLLLEGRIHRFQMEKRFIKKNGEWIWAHVTITLIADSDGQLYSMAMIEDISDRRRAQEALRQSEARFQKLAANLPGVIYQFQLQPDGFMSFPYISTFSRIMFEAEPEAVRQDASLVLDCIPVADRDAFRASMLASAQTLQTWMWEGQISLPSGATKWFRTVSRPERQATGTIVWDGLVMDVTQHKLAEVQLKDSLKEKEVLLKEVHHRVKNNLQTISSLLNLQASHITDPQMLAPFKDSQQRVKAMALIHQKLYQSDLLTKVNLADYVSHLAVELVHSYSANPANVQLKTDISAVELPVDIAIPCGFIINELVTNAIKHAFPDNRAGEIYIYFAIDSTDHCVLIIRDNGIGLPEPYLIPTVGSLGLQLVQAFVHQLRGTLELDCSHGSAFKIMFMDLG